MAAHQEMNRAGTRTRPAIGPLQGSGAVLRRSVAYYQVDKESPGSDNSEGPRLLLDAMLGRLAKWLRLAGYDTAYERCAQGHMVARRARADGRILVTMNRELARRRGLTAILITSDQLEAQVRQVLAEVPLGPSNRQARCAVCNGEIVNVAPQSVAEQVPPYVLRRYASFQKCCSCGRIYWPGSHFERIQKRLKAMTGGDGTRSAYNQNIVPPKRGAL
jgi:uncharacterized protein with PIN domain